MSHFFNYDKGENRHHIYCVDVKNEKSELLGYRPIVDRVNAKSGGVAETISEKYPQIKWKVFSTEKLARDFAIEFFSKL